MFFEVLTAIKSHAKAKTTRRIEKKNELSMLKIQDFLK